MNLKIAIKPSELRKFIFPLHKHEMHKFLSVSMIMFSMLFIYTMTKDLKDIFIQKFTVCGGAELVPVIKLFGVFPVLLLFIAVFELLIDKFGHAKTFNTLVLSFGMFYLAFSLVIFPNRELLHMNEYQIVLWQERLPGFCYYVVPCIGNWSFTLFYILSEVWGALFLPALFWQFAHKITGENEAKRFFSLYGLVGSIGVIFAGVTLKTFIKGLSDKFDFETKLFVLMIFCVGFCVLSIFLYNYSNKKFHCDTKKTIIKDVKSKTSIFKGFSSLFHSHYLLLITVTLFAYGLAVDFIEIYWQNYMRDNLSVTSFCETMGDLSILVGTFTIFITLIAPGIISSVKWESSAIITPIIVGVMGGTFFVFYLYKFFISAYNLNFPFDSKLFILFGLVAIALSRGVKYALFDSTRNLTYLHLGSESRTKGQATVESVGGRIGKSGSSVINYFLTNIFAPGSTLPQHLGIISLIFIANMFCWFRAVKEIGKKM